MKLLARHASHHAGRSFPGASKEGLGLRAPSRRRPFLTLSSTTDNRARLGKERRGQPLRQTQRLFSLLPFRDCCPAPNPPPPGRLWGMAAPALLSRK